MEGPEGVGAQRLSAMRKPHEKAIIWDGRKGIPRTVVDIKYQSAQEPDKDLCGEDTALSFLSFAKDLFNIDEAADSFNLRLSTKACHTSRAARLDRRNNRHVKLRQMYRGLPVVGGGFIVHINDTNQIYGVASSFHPGIDVKEHEEVDWQTAGTIALRHRRSNKPYSEAREDKVILPVNGKGRMAWRVRVKGVGSGPHAPRGLVLWDYYVDAVNGKVLSRVKRTRSDTINYFDARGRYSGDTYVVAKVMDNGDGQLLDNLAVGVDLIEVRNGGGVFEDDCPVTTSPKCNWVSAKTLVDVDLQVASRTVAQYYLNVHNRSSYDTAHGPMIAVAHTDNSCNGFCQPDDDDNSKYVVLVGDGDGKWYGPYCALDVIAHEWTHAVLEFEDAATGYHSVQTLSLNEAICDAFGAFIKRLYLPEKDKNRCWLRGDDLILDPALKSTAKAMRNLKDPSNGMKFDQARPTESYYAGCTPDHMHDFYKGGKDEGGVHFNCGIINKATYLMAEGGSHGDIQCGGPRIDCDPGIGVDVLELLYYHAVVHWLTPDDKYVDFRDALLHSVDDVFLSRIPYAATEEWKSIALEYVQGWKDIIMNSFAAVGVGKEAVDHPHLPKQEIDWEL
jgi:bacillolysin